MKYKINLHAHTIFSDGINSPYVMALKAKELGFSALVITDHFYGRKVTDFMSRNSMRLLQKACREAREIIPVIIGLEVPFCGQEVLVFGGAAIKSIMENGKPNETEMERLRKETGCAVILCHPGQDFEIAAKYVDGFEEYNSGQNFSKTRAGVTRPFGPLEGKPRWCNSDAHQATCLSRGYNIVGSKIENESGLIKYIKKGSQPEFYVK